MARAGAWSSGLLPGLGIILLSAALLGGQASYTGAVPIREPFLEAAHDPADPTAVTLPRLVRKVHPRYPKAAVHAGVTQSSVVVQVIIDANGRTADPVVLEAKHPNLGFEAAAVQAVKKYRYQPALQGGNSVAVYFTVVVRFERGGSEP